MILKIADWEFDIDMERTMAYSAIESAEHCDCAYCRNYYTVVDKECPQLRPFLAQFGVDVEAPEELECFDAQGLVRYVGSYVVFGRILRFGKNPFIVGNGEIEPTVNSEFDLEEPYFILALDGPELLWELDEPFEEVVSSANEPSFLKKMWDRLLGKLKSEGPLS